MEAREYKLENFVVVELRGRVDEFNTGVLRDELHTIINTGKFLIAIDLTKTDFLSAHCLKAVLSCQQRVRKLGGNLALVGPREQVQDTISYVRLHRVMHILPNLDSAKELFQKSPEEGMQAPQKTSYFSRIVNFFFKLALMISLSVSGDRLARAESPNLPPKHQYSLEDLLQLASVQGAHAKMNRLTTLQRRQELEMVKSQTLPRLLMTTGYLYQSNPNLLTQIANRQLNQIRQQGDEPDLSILKSNTQLRIEKDVMVISAGVAQAVYSGGLYEAQIHLAESQAQEQDALGEVEALDVQDSVRELYWGILLTEEQLELQSRKYEVAQQRREALELAFQKRTVAENSVAQSELLELQALRSKVETTQRLATLREGLNRLIGIPDNAEITLKKSAFRPVKALASPAEYFSVVENRHPSLRLASERLSTAKAYQMTLAAGAVRSPKAFLLGAVDHSRGLGSDFQLMNWTLGVVVSIPLYDGGRSYAEREKGRLLLEQARLGFLETKREISSRVRESVSNLKEAELAVQIAVKTHDIARRQFELAKKAGESAQIPAYRLKELEITAIEGQIGVLVSEMDYMKWRGQLQSLLGEEVR